MMPPARAAPQFPQLSDVEHNRKNAAENSEAGLIRVAGFIANEIPVGDEHAQANEHEQKKCQVKQSREYSKTYGQVFALCKSDHRERAMPRLRSVLARVAVAREAGARNRSA